MPLDRSALLRKGQLPLLLALGALPLLLALDGHSMPERLWAGPLILLISLLASWTGLIVSGKFRLAVGMLGVAVMAVVSALLCRLHPELTDVLRFAVGTLLLLTCLPMAALPQGKEMTPAIPLACGVLYLTVYALTQLGAWSIAPEVRDLFDTLLLCGFLPYMLLTLLMLSRASLDAAAAYGKVPEALRRRTSLLVVGLMLIVTLLSSISVLKRWFDASMFWLGQQVMVLIAWLASLFAQSGEGAGTGGGGGGMDLSGLGGDTAPSQLALLLEKVFSVIALILTILLAAFLLWQIYKVLRKGVRRLLELLRQYTASASDDYVDEIASTLDDADHERAAAIRRARRARRRVDERAMMPAQLIRWRYQQLRTRHPEWHDADTARDTLPVPAAEAYERARYSDHEITSSDVSQLNGLK